MQIGRKLHPKLVQMLLSFIQLKNGILYLGSKPVLSLAINGDILLTRLVCMSECLRKVCRVESQRYTTEVWGLLMTSPRLLANTSRVNEWICRKLASVAPCVSILWCSENFWLLPSLYTIELEKIPIIQSHSTVLKLNFKAIKSEKKFNIIFL